jgi:hypothetical protein
VKLSIEDISIMTKSDDIICECGSETSSYMKTRIYWKGEKVPKTCKVFGVYESKNFFSG